MVAPDAPALPRRGGLSAPTWRLVSDGDRLVAVQLTPVPGSLAAASDRLPRGIYTTMRTLDGLAVVGLTAHLDRLEEGAALLGRPATIPRDALRAALCRRLRALGHAESRLRLTLDCTDAPGTLWLSVEPLETRPPEAYERGVAALTARMQRDNPRAKDNEFLRQSAAARAQLGGRIDEILMVGDDGTLLEGLSSNLFAVEGGVVRTPEEGVLPGVTRAAVIATLEAAGLPLRREPIAHARLGALDELFVTSTSRGVLPIVEVDGDPIADGRPGPITRRVAALVAERIAAAAEPLCDGAGALA